MSLRYVVFAREEGYEGSWVDSRWAKRSDAIDRIELLEGSYRPIKIHAWLEDQDA